nr:hypothetical protein [Mycoplasmopsis bovis]
MPTEKYGINDYLDKVKEYGKEASELTTLLGREKRKGQKKLMNYKRSLDFEK